MRAALQSLRFGFRMLLKNPGLSVVATLALALGIGLTTMMFSIVYGVVLRPLPFEAAEQLIHLETNDLPHDVQSREVPFHDFLDWRAAQRSFEGLAGFYTGTVNLSGDEKPERFEGAFISANAFELLRVQPLLGRSFREGEDTPQAQAVVLLGHEVWENRYNSDPDIVGKPIKMNGEPATIIGVMPEGFLFPRRHQLWVPLRLDPFKPPRGSDQVMTLEVYGRLRPEVSLDEAQLEFVSIAKRLEQAYPEWNKGIGTVLKPYADEFIGDQIRALFFTMLGAVFLVLLIACANVMNLLLARTSTRAKEIAVRSALGAGRRRIVAQLLVETLVLALAGALLGMGLAHVGVRLFDVSTAAVEGRPYWVRFDVNPAVLLFVLGVTGLSAFVSGLIPALQASRVDINTLLKDESRGSSSFRLGRLSKALVAAEVALSFGLLIGASLMIRTVINVRNIELPFETAHLFTARIGLFESVYPTEPSRVAFFEGLLRRLRERPEVVSAAVTTTLPVLGSWGFRYELEGVAYPKPEDRPRTQGAIVSEGFFETLGASALAGRVFDARDAADGPPSVLVNRSFAEKVWPGQDPLGKRLRIPGGDKEPAWLTVTGVVPDLWLQEIDDQDDQDPAGIYLPMPQNVQRFMSLMVLGRGEPNTLASVVREEIAVLDPDLPIYWVRSMDEAIARETWFYNLFGTLFTIFGLCALFLASVGIYGVMSFSVSRRTQEIGVRMALGAQRRDVLGLILRQGAWQLGIGVALGVGLAWGVSRLIQNILYGVEPRDPATFAITAAVLGSVGLMACFIPARRAARVEPMVALRYE
jgi:predicted permease